MVVVVVVRGMVEEEVTVAVVAVTVTRRQLLNTMHAGKCNTVTNTPIV